MSEKHLAIRNIQRFQHYKNRGPIWVKFYAQTLRDEQFNELPPATRLLALYLIIVASQRDNRIPSDPAWIATECSLSLRETKAALAQLLAVAYLIPASQLASTAASELASEASSNGASESAATRSRGLAERTEKAEKEKPLGLDQVRSENIARDAADAEPDHDHDPELNIDFENILKEP